MSNPNHPVSPRAGYVVRILSLAIAAIFLSSISFRAAAQERVRLEASFKKDADQTIKVDLLVGQSRIIEFDEEFKSTSVSDPTIADLIIPTNTQIVINGLKFGQVNVIAWSRPTATTPSRTIIFDVYVQNNLNLIDNQIKILFPKENIQLSQANDSVVISGSVTNPEIAGQVEKIIQAAGFKQVVNLVKPPVTEALQVQLQIRIAEVNRQALREIGAAYGGFGTGIPSYINPGGPASLGGFSRDVQNLGGNGSPNAIQTIDRLLLSPGSAITLFFGGNNQYFIRALQERGALRSLAEPNLIAMNGKTASFISGGEFPVTYVSSVGGAGGVSVQFKQFGVQLKFTPTIIDENHIQLFLNPEVSSLDFGSAVKLSDFFIPGLRVRRAETTLELRDGQSFALAGLIDNSEQVNLSKIPGIGDIPILGELFKSRRFQRNETELLFLCTVKLVEPLNPDQIPHLPGVGARPASSTPSTPAPPEGESGHAPPRKVSEQINTPEIKPVSQTAPAPVRLDKAASATKP
ncbi:MAG TPA: type II and III secretion system protein family protein [Blastocatellia bacterium]|nr:type II and III secretion system protein family protein [Blastocatellia bacterium]